MPGLPKSQPTPGEERNPRHAELSLIDRLRQLQPTSNPRPSDDQGERVMTSFADITAASSSSSSGGTSGSDSSGQQPISIDNLICNLFENINRPNPIQPPAAAASSSSGAHYDIWASSPAPAPSSQPPIGSNRSSNSEYAAASTSAQYRDESSGSPGSVSSVVCCSCLDRVPTYRCVECNDLYCYDCSHQVSSDCQVRGHKLFPIQNISSPIGTQPKNIPKDHKDPTLCGEHNLPIKFFCEACAAFICQECAAWLHRDHAMSAVHNAQASGRAAILKAVEETKIGTKAIKAAIDRAVTLTKAYEKETLEANMKIKKVMRCFAQAIEDREKYLLDKVEKMRQGRMVEIAEHLNTLRGILAGLSHTSEVLIKSLDSNSVDLAPIRDRGKAQVDYYHHMFQSVYLPEEKIIFIPPNYDLVDQMKRQCDVQSHPLGLQSPSGISTSSINSRQALMQLQAMHPSLGGYSAHMSLLDYNQRHRGSGLQVGEQHITASMIYEAATGSRLAPYGQAIPGFWNSVTVRQNRAGSIPAFTFGREGGDIGEVSRPWGLCVDKDGNILVADRRNNRVQIFDSYGHFKFMFGQKGTGNGEFDLPAGITTDCYGRIIVIDKDNHRVQIFTHKGHFLLKFGSYGKECGQFQYPWDVAVNTAGNIVVTDTRNHRIQLFTSDGTYITRMIFEGANPSKLLKGPTTPRGVCFTTAGNILVTDFENHRMLLVDSTLTKVLQTVGREGAALSELNRPSGVVTDDDGHIIVADSKNHRVVIYGADLRPIVAVELKSPGLDDKDRPSDVALSQDGFLVVLFETLPDTARDAASSNKQYIKVY